MGARLEDSSSSSRRIPVEWVGLVFEVQIGWNGKKESQPSGKVRYKGGVSIPLLCLFKPELVLSTIL